MRSVLLLAAAGLALSGCSSTKAKADKFADQGSKAFEAKGLEVAEVNTAVEVVETQVIRDANGTAAIVTLRDKGGRALEDVPIALTVTDAAGKAIWKNDAAGLEGSLVSLPVLAKGAKTIWINDQVLPVSGEAADAKVRVGAGKPARGTLPKITIADPELEGDPVDGVAARGEVMNDSLVEQKDLVVYAVGRKGGKVVAAGRAIVPKLAPGKKAPYAVFFIGDPTGATLEVAAPPTTLENAG